MLSRKEKTRYILMALATVLLLSLLAGCGDTATPPADDSGAVATVTPPASTPPAEPAATSTAPQSQGGGQSQPQAGLTLEEAKEIALKDAGLSAEQVTFEKTGLDMEKGQQVYDVEFWCDGTEYEYEIGASSGAIVKQSIERRDEPVSTGAGQPASGGQDVSFIGADAATSTAMEHAGVSANRAWGVETELEREDNGTWVYEVGFHAGGFEYDYEIDAVSGQVLSYKSEIED